MSDFDERKILRRLNEIAQIKPATDATQRAMDKVRQQMADDTGLDEESDLGLEHKLGHKIFTIKRAIMAVAAVIVVVLVITVGLMLKSGDKSKGSETAKTVLSDKTGIRTDERTVESARSPVEVEAFLEMIEELFDAGDVSGAVTLITQASDEQRDAAMGLLARLMKEKAARLATTTEEITDEPTETTDESITDSKDLDAKQDKDLASVAAATKNDTTIIKEGTGVFSGIVIDEKGKPVPGATVFVKGRDKLIRLTPAGQADADKDGIFVVYVPPDKMPLDMPVAIWSYVKGDENHMAWTLLRREDRRQDEVDNPLGGEIPGDPGDMDLDEYERRCKGATGVLLQMEKTGKIFGTITDTLGDTVTGAIVKVFFGLENREGRQKYQYSDLWSPEATTDKNGYYEVGNLPQLWDNTPWTVKVMADGYSWPLKHFKSEGLLGEKRVDIELLLTGITVKGTVVDNYGNPLAGRRIRVRPDRSYGNIVPSSSETDADGKFRVGNCAIAEKLRVEAVLSYNNNRQNFVYYPDITAEIFIEEDKFEYEVELVATLPEITIEVEVVDPNNNPLVYFPVEVSAKGISEQWRIDENFVQRTDEDGQCIFTNVPETTGLKLIFAGDTPVPGDDKLDAEQKATVEELTLRYQTAERVEVAIIVVAGQKNYKVQARIPLRLNQDSPLGTEQAP